jgi:hypothetical protein
MEHLAPMRRRGLFEAWTDHKLLAGESFDEKIREELQSADLILLLVSPSFVQSDYCHDIELLQALKRHKRGTARVVPIIVRPVDVSGLPFAKLLMLPKGAKPITKWRSRDEAWVNVVTELRRFVEPDAISTGANSRSPAKLNPESKPQAEPTTAKPTTRSAAKAKEKRPRQATRKSAQTKATLKPTATAQMPSAGPEETQRSKPAQREVSGPLDIIALFGKNLRKQYAKSAEGEARANLRATYTTFRACLQERDRYPRSFEEAGYSPAPGARYVYIAGNNDIIGGDGSPDRDRLIANAKEMLRKLGIRPRLNTKSFLVAAVADPDPSVGRDFDVWTVGLDGEPTHHTNLNE